MTVTADPIWGMVVDKFRTPPPKFDTPLDLAQALDDTVLTTPALDLINRKLVEISRKQDGRLIISMPPQQGKSQTAVRWFVTWLLTEDPDRAVVVASYEHNVARRWGRKIRDDVMAHSDQLQISVRPDISAQQEWELKDHKGGVFSTGIGGGLTGRKASVVIIDDPVKDAAQATSKKQRDTIYSWYDTVAQTRLEPGAPVVIIMTRWHQDDLVGRLIADPETDWEVINLSAIADHRPEKGETDLLGREPGEWLESVQTKAKPHIDNDSWWESRRRGTTPNTWAAMYQGRPSPEEGGVFPASDDWQRYSQPLWRDRPDGTKYVPGMGRDDTELVQSWDMSFKGNDDSDFVVGQVWLRVGMRVYLLDMIRGRMNFNETIQAVRTLSARWPQAVAKFVEDKANGPAVMNALHRHVNGFIPVEPEGSKYARASAIAPFAYSHDIILPEPELLPGVGQMLVELVDFPNSANDDTVDTMSQAVNQLLGHPLDDLDDYEVPEDQAMLDELGYSITPY